MSFSFVRPRVTTANTPSAMRDRIAKRKDSAETIRPSNCKAPGSTESMSGGGEPGMKASGAPESRYSPDGLWKVACGDAPQASTSLTHPLTSKARAKTKGKKTHKRSNAILGMGSAAEAKAASGERKLSSNFAAEEKRQKSSLGSKSGKQAVAAVSKVNAQGMLVEPHRKGDADSKENNGQAAKIEFPMKGKDNGKEGKPEASPRRVLRVINAKPALQEDEFCDIEFDWDGTSSVAVHIEDASPRSANVSPFEGGSLWSEITPFITQGADGGPRVGASLASKGDPNVNRVSLEIKLREKHVTFWDIADGDYLKITACLEVKDMFRQTYDHRAEIHVRSFVGAPIRGIEHEDEPQFTLHHHESPRTSSGNSNLFKSTKKTINLNAINLDEDDGMADLPSWAKAAFQETDKKAQISTFDWLETSCSPVPMRVKHFGIPIPASLFDYRDSRIFRIEAKVSFRSKYSGGQYQHLEAQPVQVSVTHLHSARELGIRTHVPARLDPYKIR